MKKILIIEDDSFLSEMYATRLIQAGYQTEIADDGQKGWQKIQDTNPDLVLLDVVLPKIDGFELLKKIKNSQFDKIPVILLTNLGQKSDVEKGLKLGAHSYIIKAHFTPAAVVAKIKEVFKD
jgi:DNA-binding response OmpR family regulator